MQKAEIRKTRAVVSYDRAHDLLITASHEHIGNRLIDGFPLRDREHMRLALGAGIGDQGIRLKPLGLPEHGAGDIHRIVKGELVEDVDRGTVETSELPCKLRAGRDFDLVGEPADHRTECPYLVIAVATGDHHVGGVPQSALAAFGRTSRNSFLKLPEKRT